MVRNVTVKICIWNRNGGLRKCACMPASAHTLNEPFTSRACVTPEKQVVNVSPQQTRLAHIRTNVG